MSKKKGKKGGKFLLGALIVVIVLIAACNFKGGEEKAAVSSNPGSHKTAKTVEIKASIQSGDGVASWSTEAGSQNTEKFTDTFDKTVEVKGGSMVSIGASPSISMSNPGSKIVSCEILVDDKSKDKKQASGDYANVACSTVAF